MLHNNRPSSLTLSSRNAAYRRVPSRMQPALRYEPAALLRVKPNTRIWATEGRA